MSLIQSARRKFRQSGIRGVLAAGLRQVASRIDHPPDRRVPESQTDDAFLKWVRFAVPGMLWQGNIYAMNHAISKMPAGNPILEIGSFSGLSTVVLSYLLDLHAQPSSLFTCDKWEFEGQELGAALGEATTVTHDDYREYVRTSFLRTAQTFCSSRLPHTIECFSDEFFQRWFANEQSIDVFNRPVTLGGNISFCYIDGNHSYDFVKRDFENTHKALVPGGFILFDDSADGSGWEVNRLTREIAGDAEYELVGKYPNYLFRKK